MWDYIIVGAGSAGCVLANRLSANPNIKVLLLEAGGSDKSIKFKIPMLGPFQAMGNPKYDWMQVTEPDPTRNGRSELWGRGKVLGGTSAINGTIYVRGNRRDYDHWAQLGNAGWDYNSLLPYFRRMEDGRPGTSDVYGKGGPMRISRIRGTHHFDDVFVEAMKEIGIHPNAGYNGENQLGTAAIDVTQNRGWRWSAARGYLDPIRFRSNLSIVTNAFVRRIIIENRVAVAVEIDINGETRIEHCDGEIIISASAMNSPKLLMLSGIGDPIHLTSMGIEVKYANPAVGQNLQEHANAFVTAFVNRPTVNMLFNPMGFLQSGWKFALSGAGPATFVHSMIAFAKLDPSSGDKYPDLQFHFAVNAWEETADGVRLLDKPCVTLQVNPTRPQSRGYVRLRSPDPADAPIIQPNLLESESDFALLLAGLKMARSVFETEAFSPYVVAERTPGPGVRDDAALGDYIRNYTTVGFHPVGSVKMGTDPQSVVDPQLRVIGVAKLRVVDSSIIPQLPSANTNAISMVIGEKGADLLLEDRAL